MGSHFSSFFFLLLLSQLSFAQCSSHKSTECLPTHDSSQYISAVGDPGMKNPNVRVGFEAWNFCNEVGAEAPNMGSPRLADCADLKILPFRMLFWFPSSVYAF